MFVGLVGCWLRGSFCLCEGEHFTKILFSINPSCEALKILVPMDSGRYADVLVNITAAVLIFFLPGGYTLPLFIALALSRVSLGV